MDAVLLAAYVFSVPEPNTAPLAASCHQHLLQIATNYITGGSKTVLRIQYGTVRYVKVGEGFSWNLEVLQRDCLTSWTGLLLT